MVINWQAVEAIGTVVGAIFTFIGALATIATAVIAGFGLNICQASN